MDFEATTRMFLPFAVTVFAVVAVIFPTIRSRRLIGATGFVAHRTPSPVHRLAVQAMAAIVLALLIWVVLVGTVGPRALDVWSTSLAPLGAALMGLGGVVVVIAQKEMGTSWRIGIASNEKTGLVTSGLFRVVRNPIFSGVLLACAGMVVATPSAWSMSWWLFLTFVMQLQTRLEEAYLAQTHGVSYARYAARVGRFVPWVGRIEAGSENV